MMEIEHLPKLVKRVKGIANRRLSRKDKIRVLAAIQEFGIGISACSEVPAEDLDELYQLANIWKAELETSIFRQKEDNIVFISFGQEV